MGKSRHCLLCADGFRQESPLRSTAFTSAAFPSQSSKAVRLSQHISRLRQRWYALAPVRPVPRMGEAYSHAMCVHQKAGGSLRGQVDLPVLTLKEATLFIKSDVFSQPLPFALHCSACDNLEGAAAALPKPAERVRRVPHAKQSAKGLFWVALHRVS
jgi:hypothetical protein